MRIDSINIVSSQSVINSIYRVSDNSDRENSVNLKEVSNGSAVESLASKDGYSQDIRQLDLEDRLYRGAKSFKSVLDSSLAENEEISDELYSYLKTSDSALSDKNSTGSGYFITLQGALAEDSAQNLYNEISFLYDPSLRFATGRLVNILV